MQKKRPKSTKNKKITIKIKKSQKNTANMQKKRPKSQKITKNRSKN